MDLEKSNLLRKFYLQQFKNGILEDLGESQKNVAVIEPMFELRHRIEEACMSFADLGEIAE